jgi:hypothetical protein
VSSGRAAHRGLADKRGISDRGRRRRRLLLSGGLAGGVAVTAAVIAALVSFLGNSPTDPTATRTSTTHSPTAHSPTRSPSSSRSPATAPSTASPNGSLLTDGQSGLSYAQLAAPWQGATSCPRTFNNGAFTWTDGEYAVAGRVEGGGGPTTWYGEACSGPLPLQYGYSGVADLQGTADNLAQTFENAYYGALNHTVAAGTDEPVQVSGHAAWEVTYDVTYTNAAAQGATWTDEQAAVVVVDTGTDEPAVFFTSVPSTLNEANITKLVSALQLSSTPSGASSATPTDGGAASDGANP